VTGRRSIEERVGAEPYAYLTTTGRHSGLSREVEIWFVALGDTVYLLNGGDDAHAPGSAGWVHNLRAGPRAMVRIGDVTFEANARFPERGSAEDASARAATYAKHQTGYGSDLANWRDTGVLVALDVATE
jgi:deazaflavin-dependent oxidoreductase (nitroreductase family)